MPTEINKREITLKEVHQHNKPDDLWMVIHDKVYSLSSFLKEHPGGEEPLTENAGRDATKEFVEVGHSKEAEEMMKQYYVGDLAEADRKQENFIKKHSKDIALAVTAVALGVLTVYIVKRTLSSRN